MTSLIHNRLQWQHVGQRKGFASELLLKPINGVNYCSSLYRFTRGSKDGEFKICILVSFPCKEIGSKARRSYSLTRTAVIPTITGEPGGS